MFRFKQQSGFTLIESLLYFGLTAVLLGFLGLTTVQILLNKAKLGAMDEVSQNGRFVVSRIADLVDSAVDITAPLAGATSTSLTVSTTIAANNPTIIDVVAGVVRIKQGAAAAVPLTTTAVSSTNLSFRNLSPTTTADSIMIDFTLQYNNPSNRSEYNESANFHTTANIRNK